MSDVAIVCQQLSKRYRIGEFERYRSLRDVITETAAAPFRRLRPNTKSHPFRDAKAEKESSFWALDDVSFEVNPGEVVGIIGRNGAGKSTLLKILSRITRPTKGHAEINGRVGSLLEVGTGFHPELSGRENIYLNGAILGMRKAEIDRKFDEIVAFAEVEQFIDTPVKRYSSGMYVRLAFAVAAHMETEVLLIDEVLAVGDAEFQKKCLGKMDNLAHGGRTVLFVSHNMGAINSLCGRVVYLKSGKLKAFGSTKAVVDKYLTEVLHQHEDDLGRLRTPGYGDQISFLDIGLANGNGDAILFGQPIEFLLEVKSIISAKELGIACSIYNSSGAPVGTLFNESRFSIEPDQKRTVKLTVSNLNLAPGSYFAGFSVGRGGKNTSRVDFDIVIGAPSFEVMPFSDGDDFVVEWNANWGDIVFQNTSLELM